jgi:ABC-type uncharacterized transport system involved in gliding motility auxiliary subunit
MKTAVVYWKYLKFFFWLSPILIVVGITAGMVANSWGIVPLGLIGAGVAIAILWLVINSNALPGFLGQRSTQASTNAVIATLAVVVILGLINFLGVRYIARIDLTENRIFTLAPQSVEVVKTLQMPVKAWIFSSAPSPIDQALLDNYRRQNSQFSYEYIDPQANPGLTRRFNVRQPGEVYLEQGDESRFVQAITPEERLSERKLTNAIAQIANPIEAKVYFLQGHGERPLEAGEGGISQAIAALQDSNFVAEPLNLAATTEVPEDASVLVIADPQRALLDVEVSALEDYLQQKSGLMLLLDPPIEPADAADTGLDELLSDWGVKLSNLLLVDPAGQAAGLGAAVPIVTEYGNHPITQDFGNGISFYPVAQPLGLSEKTGVEAVSIIVTSDRTQAQQLTESGELEYDPNSDFQGAMTLGVALSRPVEDSDETSDSATESNAAASPESSVEATPSPSSSPSPEAEEEEETDPLSDEQASDEQAQARMVIIGNSSFITDNLLNQQLNGDVFLNSVSWLSQQDEQTLSIRPKEFTNRRLVLSGQMQLILALLSLVMLPLIGFGMAVGIWWMKR